MRLQRAIRHLFTTRSGTRRRFTDEVLQSIERAIAAAESRSSGEIRFVVETALAMPEVWGGVSPRERALQAFSDLHIWNTAQRNGVLIYVLAADRDVEIVADRGAADRIPQVDWEGVCRVMEEHFRAGRFAAGSVAGIEAVGSLLARHFPPPRGANRDELPNQPALL
ncbi:MAG TPA: TPM domain-containing protein [Steroidobacteraceae bacterium]|nr:TPM domain-containing protein [Steroidobacteraceae bacterium]